MDLAPLTVIAGTNASGKSNLLDALRMIQGLAMGKTFSNILKDRGPSKDLFTKFGKDQHATIVKFAVELLLPLSSNNSSLLGNLKSTRCRYEVDIDANSRGDNDYAIIHERITWLKEQDDEWARKYLSPDRRNKLAIYADPDSDWLFDRDSQTPYKDPEGNLKFTLIENRFEQIFLSKGTSLSDVNFLAMRQALISIVPVSLATPDNFSNYENRKTNENTILRELKDLALHHPEDLTLLSMRVGQIAKTIAKIDVEVDNFDRISLIAEDQSGARYLSDSLSEGTLRTIALATLLFSKTSQRTILLEEPENGIDPRVLKQVVELLADLTTDFSMDEIPHVQIICTTHSPVFLEMIVNLQETSNATAYLASTITKAVNIGEEFFKTAATNIQPIIRDISAPIAESRTERMTLHQAKAYMKHDHVNSLTDA